MLLNVHSYYSLRYGTLSVEQLIDRLIDNGYHTAVLTDINNSSGIHEYIKLCREKGFNGLAGMEFRRGGKLLFIGIAQNEDGLQELNEYRTHYNLNSKETLPDRAPLVNQVNIVYPFGSVDLNVLRENEYIGVRISDLNHLDYQSAWQHKYVILQPVSFIDKAGFRLHCQLRAIDNNILLSQLKKEMCAGRDEILLPYVQLIQAYSRFPRIIDNTMRLLRDCSFNFDFTKSRNKQTFTGSRYDDKELLRVLATDGLKYRYGLNNKTARDRVDKELEIIDKLGFSSYFLITHDIVRYGMSKGFYHVGRGSGANSVVAYCLRITDVCPIELDLYFERFLNPKRLSPPDFDIDFGWDERDEMYNYIFRRYGTKKTALLGAISTFKERSVVREIGKVYGLPKAEIDRIFDDPNSILNRSELVDMIISLTNQLASFPNLRTIHASGVLISEDPITRYSALDLPPKGLPTVQWDMYTAEDIGYEKFDILSQRGIAHIKESVQIIQRNKGEHVDIHQFHKFKADPKLKEELKKGDTIGCFYIESPAMRGLLKKLHCDDYKTLVAASSIIRPGVAKSGMMKAYIERYHHPEKVEYLHPIMEEQLKETYGVMVYQEDVLKIGHHFGGLDLADADVLRRMMSGKHRSAKHLKEIEEKYFKNCKNFKYPDRIAREVWRQIESFAGYSFSKAHSASFAVESFQSLYLKTYYPLEFYVAVINNFGGFYQTWVYVNEARKYGANILLPCVNNSEYNTTLYGSDIYIGLIHIKELRAEVAHAVIDERRYNGEYTSLENLILRNGLSLDQLTILIRIGALRFTGMSKKDLLWEAHTLLNKPIQKTEQVSLFTASHKKFKLPKFGTDKLEDAYDEIELLGFPVSLSLFEIIQCTPGTLVAADLCSYIGRDIAIHGCYVTYKHVRTVKGDNMAFGTFLDKNGEFFDTTHFPDAFRMYPFKGMGVYQITGRVVEEFGFPSIEVEHMEKLAIAPDPRSV